MTILLLVILLLLALGAFPRAGSYNAEWGYAPLSGVGIAVIILVLLYMTGHLGRL